MYILVLQAVDVEKEEKAMEEDMKVEAEVEEESMGELGMMMMMMIMVPVFFDIIDDEGADVQGKMLAASHLMQEGVAKFQARLSQLKNAMEKPPWLP